MERYRFAAEQQSAMEHMQVPFAVYQYVDLRVVTLVLSDGFCELFGYSDRATAYSDMDYDMYKYAHRDDVARISDAARKFAVENAPYDVIYRSEKMGDRSYRIIHAIGRHVDMPTGERLAYVWYTDEGDYEETADESETRLNRSLQKALHIESFFKTGYYDGLTGLPGMSYFFSLALAGMKDIRMKGKHPVILFLDLSGMKFYNGKFGFAEGDKMLRSFAKLLVATFGNECCSRFGQDHFVVYTVGEDIEYRLGALFDAWAAQSVYNPLVRVGIYNGHIVNADVSAACDMAKMACDRLRTNHASSYGYFSEDMRNEVRRRQYIIENFDRALDEHWVQVYYQPIVRAVNGKVCDEEALARWIDPIEGFMSPADFIPVLEDEGLIYKLDLYILENTLAKMRTCTEVGIPLVPQSINLSRADFDACDIVEEIRCRVDKSGFERGMINIEITESIIGKDFDFMKAQIERFQRLGFRVWMDDFGSGYSSLDLLKSIRFQLLKFDMKFMRDFNDDNNGKIILSELMKMATALGVDTICEGVETEAQVKFLREIGCSKMQGYFYSKPLPFAAILERKRTGLLIGFENADESQYFESMGRVNLHDLAVLTEGENDGLSNYYDILPMAIIEVLGDKVRLVRSNASYRKFIYTRFGLDLSQQGVRYADILYRPNSALMNIVRQCTKTKPRAFFDEMLDDGATVHSYAKRIGVNPRTGDVAIAVAVLSIVDSEQGTTYANIARVLATDYFNLFYVNIDNEQFIEYTSDVGGEQLAMERHGEHFFSESRRDAHVHLYADDVEPFVAAFTKENLLDVLEKQGTFTLTYRQMIGGHPVYVNMKAMRMLDGKHMIIGVSNVDTQMRKQESVERIHSEQLAFSRLSALAGNYVCLYTVNPENGEYYVYHATADFDDFGLAKEGKDFFGQSVINARKVIYSEDLPQMLEILSKERFLGEIARRGAIECAYRLLLGSVPVPVKLRAVLTREDGEDRLIVGVSRADAN